jgi:PIN domain nuclease of toxin-antitoxin system
VTATEIRAVLDASALVAFLCDERGAPVIERLLRVCAISTINLAEALERADVPEWHAPAALEELRSLGLTILPFEAEDAVFVPPLRRAGRKLPRATAKAGALSLGDCCCLATAQRRGLGVITDDTAWQALDVGVAVHLFR